MSRVRCVYEGEFFPIDDFEETSLHGLVHGRNLRPGTPRHTTNGYLIGAESQVDGPMWVGPGTKDDATWAGPAMDDE